jgi:histidinol phosphatase-like PHP family hydrolase
MTDDVPWYYRPLSWADGIARPVLAGQRLKVQKREWEKRADARTIALHNHSRNDENGAFPTEPSDIDTGSFDAHQSMEDIAEACSKGVVECVLMTEHNLGSGEAEDEIEWADTLKKLYKVRFLIGSEIGTCNDGAGGHMLYVPSKQENIRAFLEKLEEYDSTPGPLKTAELAYDNGDFVMIPHPGKNKWYDSFEKYLKINWRLSREDIDKVIELAEEYDRILPIATANANLPNADYESAKLMLDDEWEKEHVREFYENDAHWTCELHGALLYGRFDGDFTGEKLYSILNSKKYAQVYADTDLINRPWGKGIHMANSAAQAKLLGVW